ncbi:MAG TPA: hypothetical protein VJ583_01405 [Nitrososphaeraceae archaeon]|nr:hypothetical protein [Nitrososphaeraceae archaeon]
MVASTSTIYFGIFLFVIIFLITVHWTILEFKSVDAQKESEIDEKDKLVVKSDINLQNIEKKGMLKIVGIINGEGFIKNVPLDKIDETSKNLKVKFVTNKDNEINSAHVPDEFFVCAYHFTNPNNSNNNVKSIPFDKNNDAIVEYFDCNEHDIQSTTEPSEANLFKPKSQVFNKSVTYYNMYSHSKSISNSNEDDDDNNNSNKPIKVKILAPMEDKKNAKKIKIMAMLKGQIQSEIVDVEKEFDEIGGYTIERTFAFDRNTDMGPIQIGDRFHACVIGEALYPPEGSECEKQLIKSLNKPNILAAR